MGYLHGINDAIKVMLFDVIKYAYLSQHEGHENEARKMRDKYPDPLALLVNHQTQSKFVQYPHQLSLIHQTAHSSQPYLPTYEAPHHPQQYQHAYQPQISHPTPFVPQNAYHSHSNSQQPPVEFPQIDSGLAVPVFLPGDDPIACLNKAMAFMSNDGRVIVQQVRGIQGKVLLCTKHKRPRNSAWFKEKILLVQAHEDGQVLDEEHLAFPTDPGIPDGQAIQTTIPQNAAFQTDDLDAYDSDCDDISYAKAVLMDNLSSYYSDVLSELNKLAEDFGKRFVPQMQMSTEQAFRLPLSNPKSEQLDIIQTPVEIEVPKELPKSLKGKNVVEKDVQPNNPKVIAHGMFKLDIEPLAPRVLNSRDAHIDYIKHSQEHVDTLWEIIKHARALRPLDSDLYSASMLQIVPSTSLDRFQVCQIVLYILDSDAQAYDRITAPLHQLVPKFMWLWWWFWLAEGSDGGGDLLKNHVREECDLLGTCCSCVAVNKCLVNDNLEIERVEQENDHLFELLLSQDIVHICVNSLASGNDCREMQQGFIDEYNDNLMLNVELAKKGQMVEKIIFDEVERNVVEKDVQSNNPKVIAHGMFKLDIEPLAPRVLNNRDAHIDYIKHSREHVDTLREIVKHARALRPLDSDLDSVCKIVQRIQEVLVYVKATCPTLTKHSEKLVDITPLNKNKKVRFAETATSYINTQKQADSHKTQDSNKLVLPSTGMKSSTSTSRSQPSGNTKKNRISQTTSSNLKNKVEDQPRSVKSSSNKKNRVIKPICDVNVKHTKWKPTGQTFTIVGNTCTLTRITSTKVVPLKETISKSIITQNPEVKGSNASDVPSTSLVDFRFDNDQIAKIMGYGDYQMGNVTISRVYYVEGLGHILFSVGQFCDSDLEIQKVYRLKRFLSRLNDDDVIVVQHGDAQATLGDTNDPFTSISMSKDFADKDISANDAY
ncbi:hypothetical protein Tco_0992729 [Tanacetum coccineum]|uniref:Integrase, catalytic region, zinc finger, CCHC-type, peptidase aspartic, catalytic n=1 Tax=Tanacetum coccineum TaxID=301880 RepID=A0ABQ5F486_9ASTR